MQTVRARAATSSWETVTEQGERRLSPVVIVATSRSTSRSCPAGPASTTTPAGVVHSKEYSSGGKDFAGQDVLVVGIGNSGAELAADLVEQGAPSRVAIAVRTVPPIMPRDLLGVVPVQLLGLALTPVPGDAQLLDRMGAMAQAAWRSASLGQYGLGKAEWGPFTARRPAVIDVGFLESN